MTTLSIIGVLGNAEIYSHANYPLLEPDVFGRVGGGFVKDVILTSFWQKRIFDPSLMTVKCSLYFYNMSLFFKF